MRQLGISYAELLEVLRTCVVVCPPMHPPPYLQDFIACRLAEHHPEISDKVRCLDGEQMMALCGLILWAHTLTGQESIEGGKCWTDPNGGPIHGTRCW